jgi:hypothetical protein
MHNSRDQWIRSNDHESDTEADDRQLILPDHLTYIVHLCAKSV